MKFIKALSALDWFLAAGTVAVGAYLKDPLIAGAGAAGLLIAWYGPAQRVKGFLEKKYLRKPKVVKSDSNAIALDDGFYGDVPEVVTALEPQPVPSPRNSTAFVHTLTTGPVFLHSSEHNLLRPEFLRLTSGARKDFWA